MTSAFTKVNIVSLLPGSEEVQYSSPECLHGWDWIKCWAEVNKQNCCRFLININLLERNQDLDSVICFCLCMFIYVCIHVCLPPLLPLTGSPAQWQAGVKLLPCSRAPPCGRRGKQSLTLTCIRSTFIKTLILKVKTVIIFIPRHIYRLVSAAAAFTCVVNLNLRGVCHGDVPTGRRVT